jgi:hypothetical protein
MFPQFFCFLMEGSGSVNKYGSGRPKNLRIRILSTGAHICSVVIVVKTLREKKCKVCQKIIFHFLLRMRIKKEDGAESVTIQTWIVELLHEFDYVLLSPAVGDGLQGIRLDETTGKSQ